MTNKEILSVLITLVLVCLLATIFIIIFKKYTKKECEKIVKGEYDLDLSYDILIDKHKKNNKVFKYIKKTILYVIFAFILFFVVKLGIGKFKHEPFMVFDKSIIAVASGSMSFKHEANDYLIKNNLNDQFQTYDIILVDKVENANELKLYDVISFKHEGINVIHRIIGINPDGTYQTQGDANEVKDNYTINYNDIVGKYTGTRIAKLGLLILFLQSYAGIATLLLLFGSLFIVDTYNNKVDDACDKRRVVLQPLMLDDSQSDTSNANVKLLYKGYEYYYNNELYIGKKEILDNSILEKSKNKIIKEKIKRGD